MTADRLVLVRRLLQAAQVAVNAEPAGTAQILDQMVEQIRDAFGATNACIHFVRDRALGDHITGSGLQFCPVGKGSPDQIPRLAALERAAFDRARAHGRPVLMVEIRREMEDLARVAGFHDGVIVPLAYQGEAFAWVNVYVPGSRAFDDLDLDLLQALGGVLYGAIKKEAFIAALQHIRATLETHFSPAVVDKLIGDPESLAELRNEQLEVTVLFSDIRGFTALAERLDPADVARLVGEHLEAMAAIVFDHDGIVDKYIGDSVMAVFGSPFPRTDHADRAVAAALAMIGAQRDLPTRWGDPAMAALAIGIGVNTGPVIAGDVGTSRREFTHLGDTVNLASRLKDVAQPWQILINESTYERVRDRVAADPIEPFPVKGRQAPVRAYSVTRGIVD